MLKKKVSEALNKHLNKEMYSANLYLSMSSFAGSIGFKGTANWFMVQYQEEMVHAMKFYNYINSHGEHVQMAAMAAPPATFKGLLDLFEQTLKHEMSITSALNDLLDLALTEKDHATNIFLQWFITEQIEEEENDRDIIGKLKLIGDNGQGLLMLDSELGTRVFVPPATAA
ncbi:ferritin [Geomesophilobacter sediminis]|uniref:Ferritin n=1 Tax=Geomesophilobacter sediminis TaxID=2798584 RepID=A0A8J7JAC1_9BACT|nr:ferritin [Geomesophilobacter sediminis]MBJ6723248.1 ferritin [Geomesophilobacter sediminis]